MHKLSMHGVVEDALDCKLELKTYNHICDLYEKITGECKENNNIENINKQKNRQKMSPSILEKHRKHNE